MKVGFHARLLTSPTLRGWNRYTVNLLASLAQLGVELVLYTDAPLSLQHLQRLPTTIQIRQSPAMRYVLWEQGWLPRQCQADGIAILHSPFNFGLPIFSPCPRVLTLHDAIGAACHRADLPWRQRLRLGHATDRFHHWAARTSADVILTVSQHARADLMRCHHLPATKIAVTYEAADPRFHLPVSVGDSDRVRRTYNLPSAYLFYVGGWEERKNLPLILNALSAAVTTQVHLVLAGGSPTEQATLAALATLLGLAPRVHLLGWVPDQDLPALYRNALALVYPSRHEGFGLQLCEAMAVGCPVLAADATSLPEILGTGGELFPPDDPRPLTALIERLALQPAFRAELQQRATRRSRDFSWSRTAEATLEVYTRLHAMASGRR